MIRTRALTLLLLIALAALTNSLQYDHYFKYHNMEEITTWMSDIARANDNTTEIIKYGRTYENRTIELLKIGARGSLNKKIIWIDCGIHAREWIAPAFCQYFIESILEKSRIDAKMQELMKNLDFYVTPVLNVDGYIYSWLNKTTRLWRKNRSPGPSNCDCLGTDLNRNFYSNWGTKGVSFDCCSQTYPGQFPVSEPEAQSVTDYVGNISKDVLAFLTIHSYGQLLLIPYGHPEVIAPNEDKLMEVGLAAAEAIKKVHGMDYTVGTSPTVLYANSGSSRDWARLQGIPYCYTFELRDNGTFGFELPEDQILPTVEEAYSGAMHIITYAHDEHFQVPISAGANTAATMWVTVLAAMVMKWLI